MIVVSGGSSVLFENKHVISLRIKNKVLAQSHRPSHSMRLEHRCRHVHGSAEEDHPKVQTEASDKSLNRHVSHPRKREPSKKKGPKVANLPLFSMRCRRICHQSVGVDRVSLRKVLMEDRVVLIFWNCWDPLHTLNLQVFFAPCERDITEHILMIFLTLHEVRSDYVLIQVCGRTITVMLLRLQTAIVSSFSPTTLEEHR